MSYVSKEERKKCWGSRDDYWRCLDEATSPDDCKSLRQLYEKSCSAQWVQHFDRKRQYLQFKEKLGDQEYINANLPRRAPS